MTEAKNTYVVEPEFVGGPRRTLGRRVFDFSRQVAVMAIVNRTPDSFHDRGRTFALDAAVVAAEAALVAGADWLDFGGVPFAPGPEVTEAEEMDRVLPLIEAVRRGSDAVISVETYRPAVARAAFAAGADVLNNTSGLHDLELADAVAEAGAALVITHSKADPRTRYPRPRYGDVTAEVRTFLAGRVDAAIGRGVPPERIIIDPGHDLNKNTRHSLGLTRRLHQLTALGYPLLAAISNKDFIGETLNRPQHARVEGTLATLTVCVLQGARIVRVHDVPAAVAAVRMVEGILGWREPAYERHNTERHDQA